jgi:hypothetical protein
MSDADLRRLSAVQRVLGDALSLKDASLVVFRRGVLVEFKTEQLEPGLVPTLEGRHRGWQVGPFEGHHCHLDLASVESVRFDAEPVSCQGGRLNYTVWFLADDDCGNPYRPEGLFSVTLNAPYAADGSTRMDIVAPLLSLHDRHASEPIVSASDAFVQARRRLSADAAA